MQGTWRFKQAGNSADVVKLEKNADAGFWKDLVLLSYIISSYENTGGVWVG